MKRVAAISLILGLASTPGLAVGNHPMAGCGLGYLLFSHRQNDQVTQVLGGTTNGTFGTQTFGVSSGTSGCTEDGAVKFARATELFAEVNLERLRLEMAQGEGEFAGVLAALLGAPEARRPDWLRFFQREYANLFPTNQTTSADLLRHLSVKLAQHPELLG